MSTQDTGLTASAAQSLLPDLWTALIHGFYAASNGNTLPTLRDNISVPSSRVKKTLSTTAQKSAVLIFFAAEAWNHGCYQVCSLEGCSSTGKGKREVNLEHARRFCCKGMTTMKGEIINVGHCLLVDTV